MKSLLFLFATAWMMLHFSCQPTELDFVEETPSTLLDEESAVSNPIKTFCIPPIQIDTSTVRIQVKLDGVSYNPTANFSCVLPNLFLGIDQIWINGSTPPALKVISLLIPVDIAVGTYNLQLNSPYDARYVPSGSNNFSVDSGKLTIRKHDTSNKYIEGDFEFIATNLDSPVLPRVEFKSGCFQAYY